MVICVDLDETICSLFDELEKRVSNYFKIDSGFVRTDKFMLLAEFKKRGIPRSFVDKVYTDEWYFAKASPDYKNLSYLKKWKNLDTKIHILSERAKYLSVVTKAWLRNHDVDYDNLSFEQTMQRYKYAQGVEAEVYIDDLFFESYKMAAFGIRSFVIRKPWNIKYEERLLTNPLCSFVDDFKEIDEVIHV